MDSSVVSGEGIRITITNPLILGIIVAFSILSELYKPDSKKRHSPASDRSSAPPVSQPVSRILSSSFWLREGEIKSPIRFM